MCLCLFQLACLSLLVSNVASAFVAPQPLFLCIFLLVSGSTSRSLFQSGSYFLSSNFSYSYLLYLQYAYVSLCLPVFLAASLT